MATIPNRYLPSRGGVNQASPFLGQGGGRADIIMGLLNGQGGQGRDGYYQGGNPPSGDPQGGVAQPIVPNRYLPGGGMGIDGGNAHQNGMGGPFQMGHRPPFQDTLHSGGRFMDLSQQGIDQEQLQHMMHGMAPGGFNGDFSHVSPQFIERLAHMLRPQGPQGTPGAGMFRLPTTNRKNSPEAPHSFRQALIQRALGQVQGR